VFVVSRKKCELIVQIWNYRVPTCVCVVINPVNRVEDRAHTNEFAFRLPRSAIVNFM